MPYQTDERLKSFLDTNQLHREQMCLAIIAIDKRFSEVRPRHPRGGPDGGRDIEAIFEGKQSAFVAVGFISQADDSEEKKKRIKQKFADDLAGSLRVGNQPDCFFFLTNMNFTLAEKDDLINQSRTSGISYCEIFDRERLRIALDSPDGLSIRFQYLGLPLSEAEQSSFFARWGDDIQSVIATGFQRIQSTLDRVLFLQESAASMSSLLIQIELDKTYLAQDIGHFRAFCTMNLKEPKHKVFSVLFGSSDKSDRMRHDDLKSRDMQPGIEFGISGGQWEKKIKISDSEDEEGKKSTLEDFGQIGASSSIGMKHVKSIRLIFNKNSLIRIFASMTLRDIDEAMFLLILNSSLAEKVSCVHIYANEYKLLEIPRQELMIDRTVFKPNIPVVFSESELKDPWIRIRPKKASAFQFSFSEQTPKRVFVPRDIQNGLL